MTADTVGWQLPPIVTLDDLVRGLAGAGQPAGRDRDRVVGSGAMDEMVKRREFARAGIPRFWLVDRDAAQTVTLHRLGRSGEYDVVTKLPLDRLLNSAPSDHPD